MRRRIAIGGAVALLAAPAAADAQAVYEWTSETRAFSYIKSVCLARGGEYTVTEVVTQEILNRGSGVSYAGTAYGGLPRGSQRSSGRIRRSYSKVVRGPDPAPPEDYTITESLPLLTVDFGAISRPRKGPMRIDVTGLEKPDDPTFGPLKKGQSITLRINEQTAPLPPSEDPNCTYESNGHVTGTVTIKRVR